MLKIDEQTGAIILILGITFFALGYLWLVVRAFRTSWLWGFVAGFLPPLIGGAIFALTHIRKAIAPVLVVFLGLLIGASPYAINKFFPPVPAPIENVTTGEIDLTITDLPNYDYAALKEKTSLTVLQMANTDVTDATLEHLKPLVQLKRLDLSNSQITDAGLEILALLPVLEDLKLSRTKVTDAGIRKLLEKAPLLNAITLTGTEVKTATLREWKNARPDTRKYVK